MEDTLKLKKELHRSYAKIYNEAKKLGYNPTRFLQMISSGEDIVSVSNRLICSNIPSAGFTELWRHKRLDLSVERIVLEKRFRPLFDAEVLRAAYKRLADYEYPNLKEIERL